MPFFVSRHSRIWAKNPSYSSSSPTSSAVIITLHMRQPIRCYWWLNLIENMTSRLVSTLFKMLDRASGHPAAHHLVHSIWKATSSLACQGNTPGFNLVSLPQSCEAIHWKRFDCKSTAVTAIPGTPQPSVNTQYLPAGRGKYSSRH